MELAGNVASRLRDASIAFAWAAMSVVTQVVLCVAS